MEKTRFFIIVCLTLFGVLMLSHPVFADMWVTNTGEVGIGTQTPGGMLEVEDSINNSSGQNILVDRDIGGVISGGNKYNYGIWIDLDSSASGGQTSDEWLYLYGLRNDLTITGNTHLAYGNYNFMYNDSPNTVTSCRGNYNYVRNNNGGTIIYAYGENSLVRNDGASMISYAYGNRSEINQDDAGGTIDTSYAYYAYQNRDDGTSNDAYLYFGSFGGTHNTKWGIYLTGEQKNHFSGSVGIGTTNPGYDLDVIGDIHCTGTVYMDGGNDPPFVLYTSETRQSILDRIKDEVPPDKLSGAVLFFNGDTSKMEVFLPVKGEFRSLADKLLASVEPITETFEVEDRYYFDRKTGKVKSYKARKASAEKFKIKADHELDPMTGKFFKKIKDKDGNEKDKIEVSKEEAIEPEDAVEPNNS